MITAARQLLRDVADHGGVVRLDAGNLRVGAPQPLPDDLRARLREHKAEIVGLLAEPASVVVPGSGTFPPPPAFDAIFEEIGLDPMDARDRLEAVRLWLARSRGPPG